MKLYGISDLHLANRVNCEALEALPPHRDDWLIVAGDIGELDEHLKFALFILSRRFRQVIWVPGNHDLWTLPAHPSRLRGEARYRRQVSICREFGVLTPEDPYAVWHDETESRDYCLAPMFLLYDYSFRPDYISEEKAVDWAAESGVVCTDEELLHPDPYDSPAAWCAQRCDYTEKRLQNISAHTPIIMINHFPLREDMAQLPRFPRFSVWCGTRRTGDWHTRFPVSIVVYGHMHMRDTRYRDGVRFEEVSFGYPRDWNPARGLDYYLRQILPFKKDLSL